MNASSSQTKTRIQNEMKECLKSGHKERLAVVRMLFTEIRNAEINDLKSPGRERTEEEVIALIAAYHKNLSKTLLEYPAERQAPLKAEIVIVEDFLPQQLSAQQVQDQVEGFLKTSEERNFSVLMKQFSAQFKGQSDGKTISEVLKSALSKL